MILSVKRQGGGTLFQRNLSRGWNHLGASLGAFMLPSGSVRLTNGVCDSGESGAIFHAGIEIRDSRFSSARVYGTGTDVLLGRGSFRMRHPSAPPPHDCPDFGYPGGPRIPWAPTLRAVTPFAVYPMKVSGMYPVTGERQRDAPGAKGIEAVSGYESDRPAMLARSDAMMNRTPLDAFDRIGQEWFPFPPLSGYSDDVGWSKSVQFAKFCEPLSANIYDDRRGPKFWNQGTCPYFADLVGYPNIYDNWMPSNAQHEVRTLAPVIAAANLGDELAQLDLDVIAWNGALAQPFTPTCQPGQGSDYFGTRACSWRVWGWMHSGRTATLAAAHIGQMVACQMPNGGMQNIPYGAPFSPSPWATYGMDWTWCVEATMERWIAVHVLAAAGQFDAAHKACAGIFDSPYMRAHGAVPKFVVVQKGDVVEPEIVSGTGPTDFFPMMALGALAAMNPAHPDWQRWALSIGTPSSTKATDLRDLRNKLRLELLGRSQVVALLSVLETMGLG